MYTFLFEKGHNRNENIEYDVHEQFNDIDQF